MIIFLALYFFIAYIRHSNSPIYVSMYVDVIPNRNSNPTWLVRKSQRVNGKVVKQTLSNITKLPPETREILRETFRGNFSMKDLTAACEIKSNKPHGHVAAVLHVMQDLGIAELLGPKNTRNRRVLLGAIAARVLKPGSKLSTSSFLDAQTTSTTLNEELRLKRVNADDLYKAMDELVQRKPDVECALAKRHLDEGAMVLYDVTSSYVEGKKNEWAEYGYNRDGKKNKKQVVIGLMTDQEGCPISLEVFRGNTKDTATLSTQITKIRESFGMQKVVMVGDRGILQNDELNKEIIPVGLDWITGMRRSEIQSVVDQTNFQMSLFDEQDLVEIHCDLYPKDKLVLCRNPLQAEKSKHQREKLIAKTETALDRIVAATQRESRPLTDAAEIGARKERVLQKYKMRKYFTLKIEEGHFSYTRNEGAIQKAARLDGIYAIRSSLQEQPKEELVSNYKRLSLVEIAFRTLKTFSLRIRPIYHRKKERVVAHAFLCMLAYYVEYHMRKKLAPMLLAEDDPEGKQTQRSTPVAPAQPSPSKKKKARTKKTETGQKAMSFVDLMENLSGLCRIIAVPKVPKDTDEEITLIKDINDTQKLAFSLLGLKLLGKKFDS